MFQCEYAITKMTKILMLIVANRNKDGDQNRIRIETGFK